MSFSPDDPVHEQSIEELLSELIKWNQVVARLLGKLVDEDAESIYEDID